LIDNKRLGKDYRWSGLNSFIKITAEVYEKNTGKETIGTRCYISSLPLNAEDHWQVEIMYGCLI